MSRFVLRWSAAGVMLVGALNVASVNAESGADYDYFNELINASGAGQGAAAAADDRAEPFTLEGLTGSDQSSSRSNGRLALPDSPASRAPARDSDPAADSVAAFERELNLRAMMPASEIPEPTDTPKRAPSQRLSTTGGWEEDVSRTVQSVAREARISAVESTRAPDPAPASGDITALIGSVKLDAGNHDGGSDDVADSVAAGAPGRAYPEDTSSIIETLSRGGGIGAGDDAAATAGVSAEGRVSTGEDLAATVDAVAGVGQDRRSSIIDDISREALSAIRRDDQVQADAQARDTMNQVFGGIEPAPPSGIPGARVLTRSSEELELGRLVDLVGREGAGGSSSLDEPDRLDEQARTLLGIAAQPEPEPQREFGTGGDVSGAVRDLIGDAGSTMPRADDALEAVNAMERASRGPRERDTGRLSPSPVPSSGTQVDEDPVVVVTAIDPVPKSSIRPQQSQELTRQQLEKNLAAGSRTGKAPAKPVESVREVDEAALAALLGGGSAPDRAPRSGGKARQLPPVARAGGGSGVEGLTPPQGFKLPEPAKPEPKPDPAPRQLDDATLSSLLGGGGSTVPRSGATVPRSGAAVDRQPAPSRPALVRPDTPAAGLRGGGDDIGQVVALIEQERDRSMTGGRSPLPVSTPPPGRTRTSVSAPASATMPDTVAALSRDGISRRTPPPTRRLPPANTGLYVFGPTRPGSQLEEVADILIPADNISLEQMMWALYQKNPKAFTRGDIRRLKDFSLLDVPHPDEIVRTPHQDAKAGLDKLRNHRRASRL